MMKRILLFGFMISSLALYVGCSTTDESGDDSSSGDKKSVEASDRSGKGGDEAPTKQATTKDISQLAKAFDSKNWKELFEVAGTILAQNPHDAQALNMLALYHAQKGEWGAARLLLERALEKNKDNAGLHNNLGVIALREDNLEVAYVHFKTAYGKDSRNPNVLSNLGSVYVKYLDYGKAESLVENAFSLSSESVSVTNNLAIIRRVQGRYDQAEDLYKKILDKDPRNVSTMLNYAILLVEYMKKYDEGQKVLNKLEFLESNDPYVKARMADLNIKAQAKK